MTLGGDRDERALLYGKKDIDMAKKTWIDAKKYEDAVRMGEDLAIANEKLRERLDEVEKDRVSILEKLLKSETNVKDLGLVHNHNLETLRELEVKLDQKDELIELWAEYAGGLEARCEIYERMKTRRLGSSPFVQGALGGLVGAMGASFLGKAMGKKADDVKKGMGAVPNPVP